MVSGFSGLLDVRLHSRPKARYNQSAIHRERAAYGPTPYGYNQRTRMRQDSSYGSMQSQSAFGSMSSRANLGASPGGYSLSRQNTRSDTGERDGSSGTGIVPVSRTFSQVDSYTGTGHATTQPIAIAGRQARRGSNDSMYGFARSPMTDDLRSRKYGSRRC